MQALEIHQLTKRMDDVQAGQPWYGRPVLNLLNDIQPEFVFRQDEGFPYSIASLMAHMNYWKRYIRDVLINKNGEPDADESFQWDIYGKPDKNTWELMVTDYQQLQKSLKNCIHNFSIDPDLQVPRKSYTYQKLLEGAVDHDIYHIGQVILLQKYYSTLALKNYTRKGGWTNSISNWFIAWGLGILSSLVIMK